MSTLYPSPCNSDLNSVFTLTSSKGEDTEIHRRMGHCSSKVLKKFLGRKPILPHTCETCFKGKSTQSQWKKKFEYMGDKFEKLHADLIGPLREIFTEEVYIVT